MTDNVLDEEKLDALVDHGRKLADALNVHDSATPEQKQEEINQLNQGNVGDMVKRMVNDILSQQPGREVDEDQLKMLTEFVKTQVLPVMATRKK